MQVLLVTSLVGFFLLSLKLPLGNKTSGWQNYVCRICTDIVCKIETQRLNSPAAVGGNEGLDFKPFFVIRHINDEYLVPTMLDRQLLT